MMDLHKSLTISNMERGLDAVGRFTSTWSHHENGTQNIVVVISFYCQLFYSCHK